MFGLFGGKKKKDEGAAPEARAAEKAVAKAEVKADLAKPVEKVAAKPVSRPAASATAAPVSGASGVAQVKLRLRLAAAKRTGQMAAAYQAAKGLADIQAKAGRRLGARLWSQEAERILARDPEAA